MPSTTIRISRDNRKRLNDLGRKADTYDDILGRLLDYIEKEGIDFNELNNSKKKVKK
ncbi:MAG: hypothetical protein HYW26_01150 [Candidatus Aenigmarchaeota archaeon]|nr:hypothetical protein [Candidatus Aenigmarchaeota archaeon]